MAAHKQMFLGEEIASLRVYTIPTRSRSEMRLEKPGL